MACEISQEAVNENYKKGVASKENIYGSMLAGASTNPPLTACKQVS